MSFVIIQHADWFYLRLALSYRDVEYLLAERGVDVSCETIDAWVWQFLRPAHTPMQTRAFGSLASR